MTEFRKKPIYEQLAAWLWDNFMRTNEEYRMYILAPNLYWTDLVQQYPRGKGVLEARAYAAEIIRSVRLGLVQKDPEQVPMMHFYMPKRLPSVIGKQDVERACQEAIFFQVDKMIHEDGWVRVQKA